MKSPDLLYALLVSFGVALASVFVFSRLALKINLVDCPDHRKTHDGHVPLVGGISIFLGVSAAFAYFFDFNQQLIALMIAAVLIVAIGLLDDHKDIKVRYRLFIQFMAALVITIGGDMNIESLGMLSSEHSLELGWFSLPFTIFSIMVAINAFNFLDGIDGLSGLMFLVAMISMMMFAPEVAGSPAMFLIPLVFVVALIPSMVFNLGFLGKQNRIFLGDAGSMLLGLVVAWLLIRYTQGEGRIFSPVTALWIIAIPLMDMLAIVVRRARNGRAPFEPDRNHLHHLFMDRGMSDRKALIAIGAISILFATTGIISEKYNFSQLVMLIAFLALFFGYYQLMSHFENQRSPQTAY